MSGGNTRNQLFRLSQARDGISLRRVSTLRVAGTGVFRAILFIANLEELRIGRGELDIYFKFPVVTRRNAHNPALLMAGIGALREYEPLLLANGYAQDQKRATAIYCQRYRLFRKRVSTEAVAVNVDSHAGTPAAILPLSRCIAWGSICAHNGFCFGDCARRAILLGRLQNLRHDTPPGGIRVR